MTFQGIPNSVKRILSDNATTILTAGGVVGTVATAVLTGRAGYKAAETILAKEGTRIKEANDLNVEPEPLTKTEKVKMIWPYFVPPVLTGSATLGSIVMANRMSAQKAAALAAAYGLSEKQLREYKDKVHEKLTGQKAQSIKDELAQDRVNETPGSSQIVVVEGEVLCFDEPTGRYFRSTMENIRQAINKTNEEILRHNAASAQYFYDQIGLKPTTWTTEVGWNVNNLLDIDFSTVISHDQRPCITIDFKYLPHVDYIRGY